MSPRFHLLANEAVDNIAFFRLPSGISGTTSAPDNAVSTSFGALRYCAQSPDLRCSSYLSIASALMQVPPHTARLLRPSCRHCAAE